MHNPAILEITVYHLSLRLFPQMFEFLWTLLLRSKNVFHDEVLCITPCKNSCHFTTSTTVKTMMNREGSKRCHNGNFLRPLYEFSKRLHSLVVCDSSFKSRFFFFITNFGLLWTKTLDQTQSWTMIEPNLEHNLIKHE